MFASCRRPWSRQRHEVTKKSHSCFPELQKYQTSLYFFWLSIQAARCSAYLPLKPFFLASRARWRRMQPDLGLFTLADAVIKTQSGWRASAAVCRQPEHFWQLLTRPGWLPAQLPPFGTGGTGGWQCMRYFWPTSEKSWGKNNLFISRLQAPPPPVESWASSGWGEKSCGAFLEKNCRLLFIYSRAVQKATEED